MTLPRQRGLRWAMLLILAALPAVPAHARAHHNEAWARDRFAAAERMREALNGRLPADRSRRDYQRVINAYRNVYYGAPTSTKADPSVVAVAETLVEMGRRFDDDKILHEAIAQYKFLRREYPGSKYRCDALFTIGQIYNDDLNDPDEARATFEEFLHRYPHNRLVEDAQAAIADLDRAAEKKAETPQPKAAKNGQPAKATDGASSDTESAAEETDAAARAEPALSLSKGVPAPHSSVPASPAAPSGGLPRVTGIRHWSTPDYTRVAIDVEGDVKFGSQRIFNPDRIFFDLHDTKLASTLVGKTFDVDDGFLRKIRVAQFKPGRTRVVLEVDDLADYDAFLLPDPYRLIIDIHGKNLQAKNGLKKIGTKPLLEGESDSGAEDRTENSTVARNSKTRELDSDLQAKKSAPPPDPVLTQPEHVPATHEDGPDDTKVASSETRLQDKTVETVVKVAGDSSNSTIKKVIVEPDDDDTASATGSQPRKVGSSSSRKNRRAKASPRSKQSDTESADVEVREASPTSNGDRSLIRALGLKIGKIVIDPGHGGHDTGTIGPNGLEEKDLVLDVGLKLGKLLESRLGAEIVYTRKDDTFIPLETRTAIANQQRADLFISIHANSSRDPDARGVETYYLNFTSAPDALEVAARENAVSEKSIFELQDLVKKIALKEKIDESREFAADVQQSLHSGLAAKNPGIRNRGVKKAPFIVLIGANMPSILAEISFVSNPGDERRLETSEYRQRIAESLYRGIAKYVNGLSGVKVASKIEKVSGQ